MQSYSLLICKEDMVLIIAAVVVTVLTASHRPQKTIRGPVEYSARVGRTDARHEQTIGGHHLPSEDASNGNKPHK